MILPLLTLFLVSSVLTCQCPDGSALLQTRPPCAGGPPEGDDCPNGNEGGKDGDMGPPEGGGAGPDLSGSGPWAAPLLGDVGHTVVAGTVSEGVQNPISLPVNENIFGPFEAGFGAQQDGNLNNLGCNPASDGYLDGGIDTHTADQVISYECNVTIPRTENGIRISLLDACGGHTREYHFHERLRCLYEDEGSHSIKVGQALDGRGIYGKWEDWSQMELPLLDACGGHWGFTPESPSQKIYHYHVQDRPPFTIGCYGPSADNSLVTVAECRALYNGANGCGGNDINTLTTRTGSFEYDHWCPCFDGEGSNVGTVLLPVFNSSDAAGPGTDYDEPSIAIDSNGSNSRIICPTYVSGFMFALLISLI